MADPEGRSSFIAVNASEMYKTWGAVMGNDLRCPEINDLKECLKVLTFNGEGRRVRHNGKNIRFRVVNTEKLVQWAKYAEFDEENIVSSLKLRETANDPAPQPEVV